MSDDHSEDTRATTAFSGRQPPSVFVQWKGTDVCLDFTCTCGYGGHFDGMFAYGLRCGGCGKTWELPHTFGLIPDPGPDTAATQDTDLPHQERPTTDVAHAEVRDDD